MTVSYNSFTPVPPNLCSGTQEFFPSHEQWYNKPAWTSSLVNFYQYILKGILTVGLLDERVNPCFSFDGYCEIFIQGEWNYIFALKYLNLPNKMWWRREKEQEWQHVHGHRKQTSGCQGEGGRGRDEEEVGAHRCKLLCIQWINKVPLYNRGNYIQCPMIGTSLAGQRLRILLPT